MASKAQDTGSGHSGALFDSVEVLASTLLVIEHAWLELLSTEIEGMEPADAIKREKKKDLMKIKTPQGANGLIR